MIFAGNTFEQYKNVIEDKEIIVYGNGRFLNNLVGSNYNELFPEDKIKYIVDKDKNKCGKINSIGNASFEVKSFDSFIKDSLDNCVLLISVYYNLKDILDELESCSELKNLPYFILPLMLSEHTDQVFILPNNSVYNLKIPKIIHCFWFSGEEKDRLSKHCLESWKKYCPDYEIIEWTCKNYDVTKNKFMFDAFKAKKWAYVADYARLDVLKSFGGVYMDLDVELYKKIDFLLESNFFIGFGPLREVEAAVFGSIKDGKIVKDMLKIYDLLEFPTNLENLIVQPVYLCKLFKKYGILMNGKLQKTKDITIYPRNVFSGRDWFTGDIIKTRNAVGVHHCSAGWASDERKNIINNSQNYIRQLKKILQN